MHWIIDTDAGVDDAIAIGMAMAPGSLENNLIALTTVSGNVHVEKVNVNAGALLDLFDVDIPFFAGCDRPLIAKPEFADEFHGSDGLGDAGLSRTSRKPEPEHAALALVRLARQHAGDLSLCAIGPLTNIALASNLDPAFSSCLAQLIVMGGAWKGFGNQTSAAEFNFYVDPESAHIVFDRFDQNVIMLPWEVSLDQIMPFERTMAMGERDSLRARFFGSMTATANREWPIKYRLAGFPMPDPFAVAIALDPGLITSEVSARVKIDIGHEVGRGLSSLDFRHPQPNARIVTSVDARRAFEMIEAAWK
jgi:purine nucleosidase